MKKIKKYVDEILEEVCGAENYAEMYVEYMAEDMDDRAMKYKEMAEDELKHAEWLHKMAADEIQKISRVFSAPMAMKEKWDKAHDTYVEKMDWVKSMLNM